MTAPTPVLDHADASTDDPGVAHIVKATDAGRGYIDGDEIVALCGYRWVPTRDYAGLPVCADCQRIAGQLAAGRRGAN